MSASGASEGLKPAVLMAIGDIHLGVRCSGVPGEISGCGVAVGQLTPAAAFDRTVDLALKKKVDAVLLAGDVVERANARFEALVPLERGVRRLVGEGIPVIAVAGNHDVDGLPRLAGLIDGFTLLGSGGGWASCVVERDGRRPVEIIGWSFGGPKVRESPVAQWLATPHEVDQPNLPRIGLIHADLDASGGTYAPVKSSELRQTGFDAWLLGHIHKPSLGSVPGWQGPAPMGYLGSLVGLDASETGPHGPWLITVEGAGRVTAKHLPIAPLRWESLAVTITEDDDLEDIPERILGEAAALVRDLAARDEAPKALGLRVRLEGRNRHFEAIRRTIDGREWAGLMRVVGETAVFVDRIEHALAPPINLDEIAAGKDPPALLARRILALQHGAAEASALVARARGELPGLATSAHWSPLARSRGAAHPLSDDALRDIMLRAAMAALNALLEQRPGGIEP